MCTDNDAHFIFLNCSYYQVFGYPMREKPTKSVPARMFQRPCGPAPTGTRANHSNSTKGKGP
ncbi:hypothetical protein YC2023_053760 [Brassica napus]